MFPKRGRKQVQHERPALAWTGSALVGRPIDAEEVVVTLHELRDTAQQFTIQVLFVLFVVGTIHTEHAGLMIFTSTRPDVHNKTTRHSGHLPKRRGEALRPCRVRERNPIAGATHVGLLCRAHLRRPRGGKTEQE